MERCSFEVNVVFYESKTLPLNASTSILSMESMKLCRSCTSLIHHYWNFQSYRLRLKIEYKIYFKIITTMIIRKASRKSDCFEFGPSQYYGVDQRYFCRQFGHATIRKITFDKWSNWRFSRRNFSGVAKVEDAGSTWQRHWRVEKESI